MGEEKNNLSEDFIEDISDMAAAFDEYVYRENLNPPVVAGDEYEYGNQLFRIIKKGKTEYGIINKMIAESSNWGSLQTVFVQDFLYPLLKDVYRAKINEDPKRMLFILSNYALNFEGEFLKPLFEPLKEYARDLVLLYDNEAGQPYRFIKDGGEITAPPIKLTEANSIADIIIEKASLITQGYIDYIRKQCENTGTRFSASKIVPVFIAIEDLGWVKEDYIVSFRKNSHLGRFIYRVCKSSSLLYSSDIAPYRTSPSEETKSAIKLHYDALLKKLKA